MDTIKSAQPSVRTIGLTVGDAAPTSFRFRVLDEGEVVLSAWVAITSLTPDFIAVPVSGALNTLSAPQTRGIRVVQVEVTTGSSIEILSDTYCVEAEYLLVRGVNSFLTYNQSVLVAQDWSENSMPGWAGNTDIGARTRALTEAFHRVVAIPLRIEFDNDQSVVRDVYNTPPRLKDFNAGQIMRLDIRMLSALKSAQVAEASWILEDNLSARHRSDGLQSITVGDSSQRFGTAKPLELGLSPVAWKLLARWVVTGALIGRS